jgi:hypothetical protein
MRLKKITKGTYHLHHTLHVMKVMEIRMFEIGEKFCMTEYKYMKFPGENLNQKKQFRRHSRRQEANIESDFKEMASEGVK